MRRIIELSLLFLAFSITNIGLSATGLAQQTADQDNVINKSVDLVSVYFTVRDDKKQLARSTTLRGNVRASITAM
jgi:hypothetical protein